MEEAPREKGDQCLSFKISIVNANVLEQDRVLASSKIFLRSASRLGDPNKILAGIYIYIPIL